MRMAAIAPRVAIYACMFLACIACIRLPCWYACIYDTKDRVIPGPGFEPGLEY